MRLIHTSDWHIGRSLYGRKRYEETEAFLDWLINFINAEKIDAVLVAGDIFDNTTPSNRAQQLYYQFLCRLAASSCRNAVITAGNHDSPSFLNASKDLLRFLNVYVISALSDYITDEVLVLSDDRGEPEVIVGAVPYLRDRDIRMAEPGESSADKERKMAVGIAGHYEAVVAEAQRLRTALGKPLPLVVMGHLFTGGGQTVADDGVRDLYVGSLGQVGADIFSPDIDYLALGHLHLPQKVRGADNRRYSGSPIPMGFGEAGQQKTVCLVDISPEQTVVTPVPVPRFQALERIKGDWSAIETRLVELNDNGSSVWLEVIYDGAEIISDLRERINEVAADNLEVLRIGNDRIMQRAMNRRDDEQELDDISVDEVFRRCLEEHQIVEEQRQELLDTYNEAVRSLYEERGSE